MIKCIALLMTTWSGGTVYYWLPSATNTCPLPVSLRASLWASRAAACRRHQDQPASDAPWRL